MSEPEQVDRGYVRRRAGAEWLFKNRPLEPCILIASIKEDFQVRISVGEAKQLLMKHINEVAHLDRAELVEEFIEAMRELAIENPEFIRRLEYISIDQLTDV